MPNNQAPAGSWRPSTVTGRYIEHGQKPARVQYTPQVKPANVTNTPPQAPTSNPKN